MESSYDLPKGWFKEEVIRKSGLSAGKTDIYYHGPDGKKYRSKPQIARELGSDCDLSAFDFKSGGMMNQSAIVRRAKGKKTAYDFAKGTRNEANLTLPVRQTASIFKQPVTIFRSHPDSQVRHDLKHGNPDASQPRQLFWEKSLADVKFGSMDEEDLNSIVLPSKIKGIGPELTNENLLQSIAAALHLSDSPVVGQSQSVTKFAKNPTVHINTSQPLIQQVVITDEDIKQQHAKVVSSRRKVEELLAAIEKSNRELLVKDDSNLAESAQSEQSNSLSPPTPESPPNPKSDKKTRKRKASPTRTPDHSGSCDGKVSKQQEDQTPTESAASNDNVDAASEEADKAEESTAEGLPADRDVPTEQEVAAEQTETADVAAVDPLAESEVPADAAKADNASPKE